MKDREVNEFRLTMNVAKSLERPTADGVIKKYVYGLASGSDVDHHDDRMMVTALEAFQKAIDDGVVLPNGKWSQIPLRSSHKGGWEDILGWITKAELDTSSNLWIEAELDEDNPNAVSLFRKLHKGDQPGRPLQLGLSVGGKITRFGHEWNAALKKQVRLIHDVLLEEISIVGAPAYPTAYVTALAKSLDAIEQREEEMLELNKEAPKGTPNEVTTIENATVVVEGGTVAATEDAVEVGEAHNDGRVPSNTKTDVAAAAVTPEVTTNDTTTPVVTDTTETTEVVEDTTDEELPESSRVMNADEAEELNLTTTTTEAEVSTDPQNVNVVLAALAATMQSLAATVSGLQTTITGLTTNGGTPQTVAVTKGADTVIEGSKEQATEVLAKQEEVVETGPNAETSDLMKSANVESLAGMIVTKAVAEFQKSEDLEAIRNELRLLKSVVEEIGSTESDKSIVVAEAKYDSNAAANRFTKEIGEAKTGEDKLAAAVRAAYAGRS